MATAPSDLTLDSGALIQLEKCDRKAWAILGAAVAARVNLTVPAPVLAQVHRGNSPAMARALNSCVLESLTPPMAMAVGRLLASSGTRDIVDATVVVSAVARGDQIVTSDPGDIERLVSVSGAPTTTITIV